MYCVVKEAHNVCQGSAGSRIIADMVTNHTTSHCCAGQANCRLINVKIIACIIDTVVIQKILAHLDKINLVSEQVTQLPYSSHYPTKDFRAC